MILRQWGIVSLFPLLPFSCSTSHHGMGEFAAVGERPSELVRTELL